LTKCVVCNSKAKGNDNFPVYDKTVNLCGRCKHLIRESIMGLHDHKQELISTDILIKSIAINFYEQHKQEISKSIGEADDTL